MSVVQTLFSRLLSLRLIVITLGVTLSLTNVNPALFTIIDNHILRAATLALPPAQSTSYVTLIELTENELEGIPHQTENSSEVMALFESLLASKQHKVALLLDHSPTFYIDTLNQLQRVLSGEMGAIDIHSPLYEELKQRSTHRVLFNQRVINDEIILGQTISQNNTKTLNALPISVSTPNAETYFQYVPKHLQPTLPTLALSAPSSIHSLALPLDNNSNNNNTRQLLWNSNESTISGFITSVVFDNTTPSWQRYGPLTAGNVFKPISADGSFLPFYSISNSRSPQLDRYNLQEALTTAISTPIILVGEKGSAILEIAAKDISSLMGNDYAYTPIWHIFVKIGIVTALTIILVFLLPNISLLSGFFITAFILFCIVIVQAGLLLTQKQWLPMGGAISFIVVGYFIMLYRHGPHQRILAMERKNHTSSLRLAEVMFKQGELDSAFDTVRNCNTNDHSLSLLYDIGAQYERKRQYEAAIRTYREITSRKRSYKDAAARSKKLIVIQAEEAEPSLEFAATQSMVLPQVELKKPILGRYQIIREIGRGATGVVYLGTDPKISRQVAIKTLAYNQFESNQIEDVKARFYREAEAAGRLNHPNIVTVYDIGEESDLAFIAMDYAEGKSLNAFTRAPELLPIATVYHIIADVADALDYAHQENIVHRDIKPGNIIFNVKTGVAKVTDFGIARLTDDSRTKTGEIFGSPIYMSPEQVKGGKVTGTADIYSLGVTFYQLLTGSAPFQGDTLAELTYQIIQKKHTAAREIREELPPSANRIINKALQKDPAKRYQSAKEMSLAIRKSIARDFSKEHA